jgi:hypothetical protein
VSHSIIPTFIQLGCPYLGADKRTSYVSMYICMFYHKMWSFSTGAPVSGGKKKIVGNIEEMVFQE